MQWNPKDPFDHRKIPEQKHKLQRRKQKLKSTKLGKNPCETSEESSSWQESDNDHKDQEQNLGKQLLDGERRNLFTGRFEVPKGRSHEEYPPGYFDPMLDLSIPSAKTFREFFDLEMRPNFPLFSGDHKGKKIGFSSFFEKFRISGHHRTDNLQICITNGVAIWCKHQFQGVNLG